MKRGFACPTHVKRFITSCCSCAFLEARVRLATSRPCRNGTTRHARCESRRRVDGFQPFLFFDRPNAINLNVKRARPCNDGYKYARRRYTWEIARINRIYRSEFLDRSAIDIAFQKMLE